VRDGFIFFGRKAQTDISINPVIRHQTINNQSPYPLIMLDCFWTIDTVNDEKLYHEQNNSRRVHGEWFEVDDNCLNELNLNRSQATFFSFFPCHDSPYFYCVPSPTISLLFNTSLKYLNAFSCGEIHAHVLDLLLTTYRSATSREDFIYIDSLIRNVIPELMQFKTIESWDDFIIGILVGGRLRLLDQQKILQEYPRELKPVQRHSSDE
jgi:hypothetical protein